MRSGIVAVAVAIAVVCGAAVAAAPAARAAQTGIVVSAQPDETVGGAFYLGPSDIWLMAADGTGAQRLTVNDLSDFDPVVAPDGTVYFSRYTGEYAWATGAGAVEAPGQADIWRINADGSGEAPVTTTPGYDEWAPSISPNGHLLAYARADLVSGSGTLVVRNLEDEDEEVIEAQPGATRLEHPSWVGSGDRLAFVQHVGEYRQILTADLDGGDRRVIVGEDGRPSADAVASPDGTRIAYTAPSRGGRTGVYAVDLDSGHTRTLYESGDYSHSPGWSPDASQVIFTRMGDRSQLFRVDADGKGARALPDFPEWVMESSWFGPRPSAFPPPPDLSAPADPPVRSAEPRRPPLRLHTRMARVGRHGVGLRLTCRARGTCRGRIALIAASGPPRSLGRRSIRVRAGQTARFRVRLNANGRRLVRSGSVTARVEASIGAARHALGHIEIRKADPR